MSFLSKLYETYNQALKLDSSRAKLIPTAHTLQNAHINIVIDGDGNFKCAKALEKVQIILPSTESSAGRTSGGAPHPLADKLQYVAMDYSDYGGVKKSYFDSYKKQLKSWCESEFFHPKAKSVYAYISKGSVIEDLIKENIVVLNEKNILLTSWKQDSKSEKAPSPLFKVLPQKKGKIEQGDALVCWTVEIEGDSNSNTWTDESLQDSWIRFESFLSGDGDEGFCFITGDVKRLAVNHPAKLRHSGDKAKIISYNDTEGYTYLGKFIDGKQACGISFDATQKAHNVLRWLIERQGYRNGDQAIVAWAISGAEIPSPMRDSYQLMEMGNDDLDEFSVSDDNEAPKENNNEHNLGQQFSIKLKKKIAGYASKLGNYEKIILMAIDSATPGRMGITYYRESNATEFFRCLESWHLDLSWPQRYKKSLPQVGSKKRASFEVYWPVSTPSPINIAKAAYGANVKEQLIKNTIERLLPCIIDGKPIPKDLVDACVRRASNPNAYDLDEKWIWLQNISISCALYKGYHSDRNLNRTERRNYQMSLEREYSGRDYLYGRLLALAEKIESFALKLSNEKRSTSAERLMQRFSSCPYTTWKIIYESLRPYQDRLKASENAGLLYYWEQEIQQIFELFDHVTFSDNRPLSGEYLLGYYCQKSYRKNKEVNASDIESSENLVHQEEN
jgi:CRISPR-associated protein Csd1